MKWLLNRLKERSTWSALIALASIAGLNIKPELTDSIITAGTALVAVIFAITSDSKPTERGIENAIKYVQSEPAEPQRIVSPESNATAIDSN